MRALRYPPASGPEGSNRDRGPEKAERQEQAPGGNGAVSGLEAGHS
jgi:hypothetical protein